MSILDYIGAAVEACSYNFRPGNETDFADSLGGSWYVSPTAHGVEFLTVVPFYLAMTTYFGYKAVVNKQALKINVGDFLLASHDCVICDNCSTQVCYWNKVLFITALPCKRGYFDYHHGMA
ncbi:hypothetical protein [Parasitella parasitica]|uniref:Uncharacterized protein n=1 Tax=Parasitella parasitica TaxID=35722 RepID=A0A0B7NIV6_9FUNG|nr:hypothetical protein [Parasitella parasitica]